MNVNAREINDAFQRYYELCDGLTFDSCRYMLCVICNAVKDERGLAGTLENEVLRTAVVAIENIEAHIAAQSGEGEDEEEHDGKCLECGATGLGDGDECPFCRDERLKDEAADRKLHEWMDEGRR